MARLFTAANSDQIQVNTLGSNTTQLSVGCWYKPTSQPPSGFNSYSFLTREVAGNGSQRNYSFDYRTRGAAQTFLEAAWTISASNFSEYFVAITLSNGTWHHILWVIDFTANPYTVVLYVDGVSQSLTQAGPTSGAPLTATQVSFVGANSSGTELQDGTIAEAFRVTGLLNANNAKALALGKRTKEVLAGYQVDLYAPLGIVSGSEVDLSGNLNTFTLTGTSIANHAPIELSSRSVPSSFSLGTAPPPPTGLPYSNPFLSTMGCLNTLSSI